MFPSSSSLHLQNVDHKTKFRSKKGLLPFIELNGEEIADSAIIIKELTQRFEQDIDASLTLEQKNIAHATISMIENHLVWVLFYWRTKHPDMVLKGYKVNLQHALGTRIPNGILNFFFKFAFGRKVCTAGSESEVVLLVIAAAPGYQGQCCCLGMLCSNYYYRSPS